MTMENTTSNTMETVDFQNLSLFVKNTTEYMKWLYNQIPEGARPQIVPSVLNAGGQLWNAMRCCNVSTASDANRILYLGMFANAVSLAVEYYKLKQVWQLVKEANNLVDKSGEIRRTISNEIEEIRTAITNFDRFVSNITEYDMITYIELAEKRDEIVDMLTTLHDKIRDLEFMINGKKQQLSAVQNQIAMTAINSAVSAFAGTMTSIMLETANPWLALGNFVLSAAQFLVSVENIKQHGVTGEMIKKLDAELAEVLKLKAQRGEIDAAFKEKFKKCSMLWKTTKK